MRFRRWTEEEEALRGWQGNREIGSGVLETSGRKLEGLEGGQLVVKQDKNYSVSWEGNSHTSRDL